MSPVAVRSASTPPPIPVTRLEKATGWRGFGFADLWHSRELLFFLALRDVKVRYKQTFFGAAWAVAQPLITMVVFTLVFGRLAELPSEGVPYSVFVLAGVVPWSMVASGTPTTASSLLANSALITKVRIHSVVVPVAAVLGNLLDLGIAILLLLGYAALSGVLPGWELMALPVFVLLGIVIVTGVGLLLSSVSVLYRDVRYVVPFGVQVWLFLTPVVYPTREVDEGVQWLYSLNPMVGVVEGFRWSVIGTGNELGTALPASVVGAVLLLLAGAFVFRRLEPIFADAV